MVATKITKQEVDANRAVLANAVVAWAADDTCDPLSLPEHVGEVRTFQVTSGRWASTVGSKIAAGWDGAGPYWQHFTGEGATEHGARLAARADMVCRTAEVPA